MLQTSQKVSFSLSGLCVHFDTKIIRCHALIYIKLHEMKNLQVFEHFGLSEACIVCFVELFTKRKLQWLIATHCYVCIMYVLTHLRLYNTILNINRKKFYIYSIWSLIYERIYSNALIISKKREVEHKKKRMKWDYYLLRCLTKLL